MAVDENGGIFNFLGKLLLYCYYGTFFTAGGGMKSN